MADNNRRDFLKKGVTAALGVGAIGTLTGAVAAGCGVENGTGTTTSELAGTKFALNEAKYRQLVSFPDVRKEFVTALDEVANGLLADSAAYLNFMETTDSVGSLRVWDANAALLTDLIGPTDATTKQGRLKRILAVSELYDGVALGQPGFLDSEEVISSSSSSSVSSGGDCATNGSPTNGCCVVHTWGWSAGDGLCSGIIQE